MKVRNAAARTVIVPMHHELAPGTLRSILRQAGLTNDEFSDNHRSIVVSLWVGGSKNLRFIQLGGPYIKDH